MNTFAKKKKEKESVALCPCGDKPGRLTVSDAVQERLNIQRRGVFHSDGRRLIVFGSAPLI